MGMGKSVTMIRDNAVHEAKERHARIVSLIGKLDDMATIVADLAETASKAYANEDHKALGHGSWAKYCETLPRPRLSPPWLEMLVMELRDAGMSYRGIAPVVGKGAKTIQRMVIAADEQGLLPEERVSNDTPAPVNSVTVGTDGKRYERRPKPAPKPAPVEVIVDAEVIDDRPLPERPVAKPKPITDPSTREEAIQRTRDIQEHAEQVVHHMEALKALIDKVIEHDDLAALEYQGPSRWERYMFNMFGRGRSNLIRADRRDFYSTLYKNDPTRFDNN